MSTPPLILVSNDDGYGAPGIEALVEALQILGEVAVVAPDRERSGVGRAITLHQPLRAIQKAPLHWTLDGTPTDCVYVALHHLLPRRPVLVVSGINRGPNLADDMLYSGTVGAAMEGAMAGLPAVSVSFASQTFDDYRPAAAFAVDVARYALTASCPERCVLNVNVPDTHGAPIEGFRWTRAGRRDYSHSVVERVDPRGRPYYWLGGTLNFLPVDGGDCDGVAEGLATITPIQLDLTNEDMLRRLKGVELPGYVRG